jgi:uncharacterized protein YprB with RNaseH-like and TPR domain
MDFFMVRSDILERLTQLNKGALRHSPSQPPADAGSKTAGTQPAVCEPALRIRGEQVKLMTIEEAVPGVITKEDAGEFLLIKHRLSDIYLNSSKLVHSFRSLSKAVPLFSEEYSSPELSALYKTHPSQLLFLDIETCGLSNAPLFLVGVAYFTGEDFSILQLFARNYSEERPLLSFFTKLLSQYAGLITFNGKSFDMPFIISRGQEYRIDIPGVELHIDLLFEVRRYWRQLMPDCKLQTVERYVFGRRRNGDIPGSRIPAIYDEFVQTGNIPLIQRVLDHNILDIITMIEIVQAFISETSKKQRNNIRSG